MTVQTSPTAPGAPPAEGDDRAMPRTSTGLARRALVRCSTPRKLANLALCQIEKRTKPLRPRSRPYQVNIDLSNACSLRCPYCPTGNREFGRKPGFVSLEDVETLMQGFADSLYIAFLYSWGEPLMHPKVAEIVSLVRKHRVMTDISTHFNQRDPRIVEAVCDAGLDHLKLSIDGASQAIYEKYRVGGKFELVLENVRHVVEYKRRHKLRSPSVEWQFLVFDHNRHEIDAARELARKLGVDIFRARPGVVPADYAKAWGNTSRCSFLYDMIAMQVDGGIVSCCHLYDKADDFAPRPSANSAEIWHSQRAVEARRLFRPDLVDQIPKDFKHPCLSCSLVSNQPHLAHLDALQPAATAPAEAPAETVHKTIAVRIDTVKQYKTRPRVDPIEVD